MRALHQLLGQLALDARHPHVQLHGQADAAADGQQADVGGDRGLRHVDLTLGRHQREGAEEARRVAGGEELLGVRAVVVAAETSAGTAIFTSRRPSSVAARPLRPPCDVAVATYSASMVSWSSPSGSVGYSHHMVLALSAFAATFGLVVVFFVVFPILVQD